MVRYCIKIKGDPCLMASSVPARLLPWIESATLTLESTASQGFIECELTVNRGVSLIGL